MRVGIEPSQLEAQDDLLEFVNVVGTKANKRNKEGNQEKKRKMEDYGHTNESRTRTKARKMTFTEVDDEQLW